MKVELFNGQIVNKDMFCLHFFIFFIELPVYLFNQAIIYTYLCKVTNTGKHGKYLSYFEVNTSIYYFYTIYCTSIN